MIDPSGALSLISLKNRLTPTNGFKPALVDGLVDIIPTILDQEDDLIYLDDVVCQKVELTALPKDSSFLQFLSPAGKSDQLEIQNGGEPLEAAHLVALTLNEICREMRQGAVYCMPRRQEQKAHPCDLIFINEIWGSKGNAKWDKSTWSKRLDMVQAETKIGPAEKVIPLCLRIFKFDVTSAALTPESSDCGDSLLTPLSEGSDLLSEYTVDLPTNKTFPYATTDDPVIKQNTYQYSRRLEDLSTYLITFNSPLSTPFICLTGAAEHELNCIRYLNPNDLSETFARRMDTNNDLLSDQTNAGDRAQELIIKGAVGSHKEVIHMLREAFEQDERLGLDDPDQRLFGRVTYLWQEIVNRVEDNGMYDGSFDRSFWPGGG